jgi:dTDP-4-dehydrorhamnose 3,5-epimerase
VQIRELSVPDAYEITPELHEDNRGLFLEWYRADKLTETLGHSLNLQQANTSVSDRGVLRGIHFADVPRGQAKYVTVVRGAVIDFVVDIRVGSSTFGEWDSVLLDDDARRAVYLREGLGHAFLALTNDTTVSYLVSDVYKPNHEHAINPMDSQIGLRFPFPENELFLSPKDMVAPSLDEALTAGILPTMKNVQTIYTQKRA